MKYRRGGLIMRLLASLITAAFLSFNVIVPNDAVVLNNDTEGEHPNIIDAFTLAFDAMYTYMNFNKDYIILDMESYDFTTTTYEERQNTINYFNKYNKTVLNASLFKLQQIGLADDFGDLKFNGELLMFTCVKPNPEDSGIIIEGINYVSPIAIHFYTIKLKVENNKWVLKDITLTGVA
jgi:hypothetical protein